MHAQMTEPDLASIVDGAVSMMLGLDLGELVESSTLTSSIGAAVQFTGDWEGAVVFACDDAFGCEAAAAMFGSGADTVTSEEIADALGELANMIAGNVKPLLPAPATLSLPTVVQGAEVQVGIPGAREWVGVTYRKGSSVLSVRIYERQP